MIKRLFSFFILFFALQSIWAQQFVTTKDGKNVFPLVLSQAASILIDSNDNWLVSKAAHLLQHDIEMVTGMTPRIVYNPSEVSTNTIIIGTLSESSVIKKLLGEKKISTTAIEGKWESFRIQTIASPFSNKNGQALLITGSDKRGVAYGVFELSKQIGVSPWYWWADVPVKKKKQVFIKNGTYIYPSPAVKYRGLFINDEAPAFSGWAWEKFGGFNHDVYEKVFELLLRLRGNYLWPAMWDNAFNDDDTLNPVLADKWGIVMGTSHHEPMLRAQQEWKRYGQGPWDYTKNDSMLRAFWKKGIENMDHHESIVTVGMRGDGDEPMTRGTAIHLLEKIVTDQRKIIEQVTGRPAPQTPQVWALYKEVQDYYDKGMRVPDDVTLLLCDDNWGNIRRLPMLTDKPRSGGYGIYYHFDYVGDPRNYKWINTNNIARVWEQMHLAYSYGVNNIWVVNVGDLKPMEFPVSFWFDYAWDPKKINEDNLPNYYKHWAAEQFGEIYAKEIGNILEKYTQYASRRKPELLDDKTYSLENYSEWDKVLQQWETLLDDAEKVNEKIPVEYKDAFFQLVLHPLKAMENLHELYYNVARNKLLASHNDIAANRYADKAKEAYLNDSLITLQYHRLHNGKWNHMMDQTHIGYTYWQQPEEQKMPEVTYVAEDLARKENKLTDKATAITAIPINAPGNSFYQEANYVSIQAAHYTRAISTKNIKWKTIKNIGRDGDGVTTFPVTSSFEKFSVNNPQLQYEIYTSDTGIVNLNVYFSPTLNFHNTATGLQYAIAIDDETPQVISINNESNSIGIMGDWVANNIIIKTTQHHLSTKGKHVVKYFMISNAVVLQKLVLSFGDLGPGYLGPQETIFKTKN